MITLEEAREHYYSHSGSASEVARNLALAGLAVVWIFKVTVGAVDKVPDDLVAPAALFAAGLGLDLLQYLFSAVLWGCFQRSREHFNNALRARGARVPERFLAPRWINWPGLACWTLKLVLIVAGHAALLAALFRRWAAPAVCS